MNLFTRSRCYVYLNKEIIMLASIGFITVTYFACKLVRIIGAYARR